MTGGEEEEGSGGEWWWWWGEEEEGEEVMQAMASNQTSTNSLRLDFFFWALSRINRRLRNEVAEGLKPSLSLP